jgi:exonuclease III
MGPQYIAMLKLISWNVNARVKEGLKQVKALENQEPDVIAFQDIKAATISQYEHAFAEIGLPHVLHTFQDAER